ncbi:MAG: DUF1657 domain-containing protein [Firmicutes bacterium]|nr:DUF1657 domain-containing protein [Dethiobacter sp.]MBS3888986.1 DUF1657 domain-containing protein [Bacillota bacterium]MBS4055440.1 DUF1657 domain-containing protein [Thermaerobacter sp.]
MTIASQLSQTLANMEGAAASLKTFSLQTQDQQAKQLFQQLSQSMDHSVQQLRGRLDYITQEEPQYRSEIGGTYASSTGSTGSTGSSLGASTLTSNQTTALPGGTQRKGGKNPTK